MCYLEALYAFLFQELRGGADDSCRTQVAPNKQQIKHEVSHEGTNVNHVGGAVAPEESAAPPTFSMQLAVGSSDAKFDRQCTQQVTLPMVTPLQAAGSASAVVIVVVRLPQVIVVVRLPQLYA
jgi:trimethylamine:corrinoid methyltransferase-like protein